jgi:nitrate/TMAO reductase-like tetraheme cytochrome c subunit
MTVTLLAVSSSFGLSQFESSQTCKKCHPLIYEEHYQSQHRKASIFLDPIHKAVWDKHPFKKEQHYQCAKCHTPNDKALILKLQNKQKAVPIKNKAQLEGVSCVSCHNIKSIQKHTRSNRNIITKDKKTLYSARTSEKFQKDKKFTIKEKFFGLVTTKSGSPYHDIDFTNEIYYTGDVCMGCHSHKENEHRLKVCDSQTEKHPNSEKENCISCHMPKIPGSFTTLKDTKTHRYHGFTGTIHKPHMLEKYVDINLKKSAGGFDIEITNHANHPLLMHPLRVGELRVDLIRNEKRTKLAPIKFLRLLGKNGHPAPPWIADSLLKNTQIQAKEQRIIHFALNLQHNDTIVVKLGAYTVNPKMAQKLGIGDKQLTSFHSFKEKVFHVK